MFIRGTSFAHRAHGCLLKWFGQYPAKAAAVQNLEPVPRYQVHNKRMRIGQLATRAGVNIQTIRFYERRQILGVPPRSVCGFFASHRMVRLAGS